MLGSHLRGSGPGYRALNPGVPVAGSRATSMVALSGDKLHPCNAASPPLERPAQASHG